MNFDVKKIKIVVTVPFDSIETVRDAMCNAGAGIIGNYTFCSTSTKCVGTFMPNIKANPYRGEKNKLDFVEEEKLEMICDVTLVKEVITRLRQVHPYEEPAIDLIPLLEEEDFS